MVLDSLGHIGLYQGLGPGIGKALAFLTVPETPKVQPPAFGPENSLRVEIEGDRVFALVQRIRTKPPTDAFWEAHRNYIDVQCVIEGTECMGHCDVQCMRVNKPYDEERDFITLEPDEHSHPTYLNVHSGMFTVFFPHDAHMPGLCVNGTSSEVKKIVVKVRV